MNNVYTTLFLSLFSVLIIVLIIGKLNYSHNFKKEVERLFSNSKSISYEIFNDKQHEGLPDPVKRYFKHVLKDKQPYISYVRLKHNGQFKTGIEKSWTEIHGEQYFSVATPGFIWKGKMGIISARDMYLSDKGRLVVTLLNLFKLADKHGESFNQGELLRWLGESVWYPTNLLPSNRLKWLPIDDSSAKLIFDYRGLSLFYTVRFNEKNEIIQLETERLYDEKNVEKWIGNCSNYKEINNVKVPTVIKATWRLKQGDHNYVIFNLKEIMYDLPKKY